MTALVVALTAPATAAALTLSGQVTGPDGQPIAGARVSAVTAGQEGVETVTGNDGSYSLELAPGDVNLFVEPAPATRLVSRSVNLGALHESTVFDVRLEAGSLVSGTVRMADGRVPSRSGYAVGVSPMIEAMPVNEWLIFPVDGSGAFGGVVPKDVVWFDVVNPRPLFSSRTAADTRDGDVDSIRLTLSHRRISPIPFDPPVAAKIAFSEIDGMGEAAVTGAAGAVPPHSRVLLVNLASAHQETAVAAADGSFTASIYAPPASPVMIKHGPQSWRWEALPGSLDEWLNPFPGTIIQRPFSGGDTDFDAVGSAVLTESDVPVNRESIGAAWWFSGSVQPVGAATFEAGGELELEGRLRVFSPAFDASTAIDQIAVSGVGGLFMQMDGSGRLREPTSQFLATDLTPTGLPIQTMRRHLIDVDLRVDCGPFSRVGEHEVVADLEIGAELPDDLPPGVYRPAVELHMVGVPEISDWTASGLHGFTTFIEELTMPPIAVGLGGTPPDPARMPWRLFYNRPVLGTRGVGAYEDSGSFQVAPQIVTQGALYVAPPTDLGTGDPIDYRLEPFLPMVSGTDRRLSSRPWLPLDLPGGEIEVRLDRPDGTSVELGPVSFAQSFIRTPTTAGGEDLNIGTQQLDDVCSLTTLDDDFTVRFDRYGPHLITVSGWVEDLFGTRWQGGGTYEVLVAHPLDMDFGVLPGTPLAAGDAINPALQLHPPVPAEVTMTVTLLPDSDPDRATVETVTGTANRYGAFSPGGEAITVDEPGELRIDLMATYETPDGRLLAGTAVWGGVVMTPPDQTELVAHGRRGLDCLLYVPSSWFVSATDITFPDETCHTYNPYFAGDVVWSRLEDGAVGGDSLVLGSSFHDAVGAVEPDYVEALQRADGIVRDDRFSQRLAAGELPLYTLTESGRPWRPFPDEVEYRAYAYGSSQRPGVRVREAVADDTILGLYWRLDTLYDDQPGVGIKGDQTNEFKFQYVGIVFRDLATGFNQYLGQGTGWVYIPPDDPLGSRVMPPFAGAGNGGWTTQGGPLMTVKGEDIHLFAVLTGTHPGAILEVGERFRLAGHLMPTLPSRVELTLTAPDGTERVLSTRANSVGYFYDPTTDLVLDEAGVWTAELRAWHDGSCSGGRVVEPYPEGSVLGAGDGTFEIYVVPVGAEPLELVSPSPGRLEFDDRVHPVPIRGELPDGATVHATTTMPGWVLGEDEVVVSSGEFEIVYDPVALHRDFPNLDLSGREESRAGLADTVLITLLATGSDGGTPWFRAATVSLQGQQVAVNGRLLPEAPRSGGGRRTP